MKNNADFEYPILILKENDKGLYCLEKDFGLVSKGGESFYRKLTIYDKSGRGLYLSKYETFEKADFLSSIKYFQQMYQITSSYVPIDDISLDEIKQKLIRHIEVNKKYWLKLDNFEDIKEVILGMESFEKLYKIFL